MRNASVWRHSAIVLVNCYYEEDPTNKLVVTLASPGKLHVSEEKAAETLCGVRDF